MCLLELKKRSKILYEKQFLYWKQENQLTV